MRDDFLPVPEDFAEFMSFAATGRRIRVRLTHRPGAAEIVNLAAATLRTGLSVTQRGWPQNTLAESSPPLRFGA
jgi:hypothetical protein